MSDDNTGLVDDHTPLLVDKTTSESCVLDLRAVKDARLMADMHYKVNGVKSSTKEVLEYALSLQVHYKETGRYS